MQVENLNLTAIRTIRVLRPLRAINRIPSEYGWPKLAARQPQRLGEPVRGGGRAAPHL